MAQTGYTPLSLYYSTTASAAPTAGNLINGELGLNITDGKLYYKDNLGVVQVLASKGTGTAGGANTQVQYNSTGALAGSANMTFNGTSLTLANVLNAPSVNGATTLSLATGGTTALTVDATQEVGIGVTNPLAKLHVVGGNSNNMIVDNGGQQFTTFSWYNNGVEKAQAYWDQTNSLFVSGTDVAAASVFKTDAVERMRISGTGKVSIGTASTPISLLINGTDALGIPVGTTAQRPTGATGYIRFNTDTPGFEGYNGTSWSSIGGGGAPATTDFTATGGQTVFTLAYTVGNLEVYRNGIKLGIADFTATNGTSFTLATGAVAGDLIEAVQFTGTTTPGGVTSISVGSNLTASGATGAVTLNLAASPSVTSLTSSADVTIHGLTVGLGGGAGSQNTVVGISALANSGNSGSLLCAFGNNALASNTTGVHNNAFGGYALYSNLGGQYNDAFGTAALQSNTSGSNNAAFGQGALTTNTTSSNNAAFGFNALTVNTGASNTAIGIQALTNNTTADNNTAVGYQAGYSNTTGTDNAILGYQALYNATGGNNVAVGSLALNTATNGGANTSLGYAAGNTLTTGSNNTYVGAFTVPSSGGVSNESVFGYGVAGKGANTVFIAPNNAGTGNCYQSNNSASWATTSDGRIKENVVTVENGLQIISQLRPVTFDYILNQKPDVGFIAQEYQEVLPDQVNTHAASPEEKELVNDDTLLGITPNLVPYLVAAIKELNTLVTAQAADIAALKAKVGI